MPLLDIPHLSILTAIAIGTVVVVRFGRQKKGRAVIPMVLAGILLGSEFTLAYLAIEQGIWSYRWALPLHLCDLAVFGVVLTLLYPIPLIGELSYVWVIGGSIPAVLTPDVSVWFPSPFFLLFFVAHGGAIISAFYLVASGTITFSWHSLRRVWLATHLYVGVIAVFNTVFETNYLFLCEKPGQFSPLDYLGPWPIYLIGLEVLFTASLFLSYAVYQVLYPRE